MRETISYDVWPRPWALRERLPRFLAYVAQRNRRIEIGGVGGISFRVRGGKTIHCASVLEVDTILERFPEPLAWRMQVELPKEAERASAASLGVHIDAL